MFDFTTDIHRRGSGCYKWDETTDPEMIPMWVADMDFRTAPCIIEALQRRVAHGAFGYTLVGNEYYEAVINWWQRRHGWTIEREWIQYTSGVVPAISVIIKALTEPGDRVAVMTPVYNCFFSSIRNNGCEAALVELIRNNDALRYDDDALRYDNVNASVFTYSIAYEALERECSNERTKLLLLCNPHNPAGRVWTAEELAKVNEICLRNGVKVVSDEIHCELTMPGYKFTPFASISENCLKNSITCNSPSKAFNTAGLQIANIICCDAETRAKIDRAININEVCDVNPFGVVGLIAAYNEGEEWLKALNEQLHKNYLTFCDFFTKHIPTLPFTKLEGTYLVWVDVSSITDDADTLCHRIEKEAHVQLNSGTMYDPVNGKKFVRINLACPESQLTEALNRIDKVLNIV